MAAEHAMAAADRVSAMEFAALGVAARAIATNAEGLESRDEQGMVTMNCLACKGDGKCTMCGGAGKLRKDKYCDACGGSGNCRRCGGSGQEG